MRSIHWKNLRHFLFASFCAIAVRVMAQSAAEPPRQAPSESEPQLPPLRQILLADSPEAAQKLSLQPNGPLIIATGSLKHLESDDLTKRLAAASGHVIDKPLLQGIAQVLSIYVRQHGYLICDISVPDQNISDGAVRFAVVPGKFRQIKFVGNRWFSESQLRDDLHINRGEIIRFTALDEAIGWTNDSNPFRRVQARVQQVPNSNEGDLIIGVQERMPLRLVFSVDDSGNEVLGQNHYMLAATYANLWNLDHQATYQYVTTNHGQNFIGHVFSYRAPLAWHHFLQVNASYLRARPVLLGGYFNQDAENITGDIRYTVPVHKGDSPSELFANASFKESNNDLQFGGSSVQNSKTDIFELTLGASKVLRDKLGGWAFGVSATVSPGHVNSRNTDAAFANARGGTKSRYAYASFSFQRGLALKQGWEFASRGNLQISDNNLLSSEQLAVGGSATVRGFNENIFAGDEGFVFDNDLLTPVLRRRVSVRGKQLVPLETRFVAFYDAAQVRSKHAATFDPKFRPMASTGVGVRINWATNFSVVADYGWQITHLPYAVTEHSHGHIKVTLAY